MYKIMLADDEGIVLDAFSESLALPFEIADIINEIPSQLSE